MSRILVSEYRSLLAEQAAQWGADNGADLSRGDPQWTAPLGHLSVSIVLEDARGGDWSMVPRARIGASGSMPRDAHEAIVVLLDAQATLQRSLSCVAALGTILVYSGECPCNSCSATGKEMGYPCKRCGGTGKRQEPAEGGDHG